MGNCCGGNGCCKKPDTCVGMAVLIVSIIGIVFSLTSQSMHMFPLHSYEECCDDGTDDICADEGLAPGECVDRHITLWVIAIVALHYGQYYGPLYMLAIGLFLAALSHIIATTGFSLPVCCCTSAKGYKCSAIVLGFAIGFYTVAFFMSVGFHGAISRDIGEDEEEAQQAIAFWMGIIYAIILVPCLLGIVDCGLLCKGKADWPEGAEGGGAAVSQMPPVAPMAAVEITASPGVEKAAVAVPPV